MPNGKNSLPDISDAEWQVMKVLWEKEPLAARDVYEALPAGHGWAIKTVKTLLSRLVAKGAVTYEQVGNSYLYRSSVNQDHMTRKEVRGFLDRVIAGSAAPIMTHFIEETDLSDDDIRRLRALLEKKEKGRSTSGGGEDSDNE